MNKKKMTKTAGLKLYLSAYLPSVAWAGIIFFFSNQSVLPGFEVSILDFIFKKGAHMFVYAVLYYLLFRAYKITHPDTKISHAHYLWPLFLGLLYAISDELHQSTVAGRYATARDVGYDVLGMSSILLHQQKLI